MTMLFTDQCLRYFNELMCLVQGENYYQLDKWEVQTRTPFEWMNYTTEELGELAEAISNYVYSNGPAEHVIREAIQVATLALKIAEMVRVHESGHNPHQVAQTDASQQ